MALTRPVNRQSLRLSGISTHRPILPCWKARHPLRPLSTETVTDDHVAELAAKPIHPLTLGDLVKYGIKSLLVINSLY